MSTYGLVATAAFGLEAVVAKEVKQLGFSKVETENGRVFFQSKAAGICRANLWLRTADRVHILMDAFEARTFTELFDGIKALDWPSMMLADAKVVVNAKSVKSTLFSLSDIQSIAKKAIVESMKSAYGIEWLPETGAEYPVLISILKDRVEVLVDTSGDGLHKRGYRAQGNEAPIKETLAAALVQLSGWKPDEVLCDPLCGTGTILIEAAMIGRRIAPGLYRRFVSESWPFLAESLWKTERAAAYQMIDHGRELHLYGSDSNGKTIEVAVANADKAGVHEDIVFETCAVESLVRSETSGVILTNPPYGERLGEESQVLELYRNMGRVFSKLPEWRINVITSSEKFEKAYGRGADKNRKLYNGRIKCYLYQYETSKTR